MPPQRSFCIPSVAGCAVELNAHKCDGSQRRLAVQMRAEQGQVPLLRILFCPGNRVPCNSAQKQGHAVLGTVTYKVATRPCLKEFTEKGMDTV